MWLLARLRPLHLTLACIAWAVFVGVLPQLILLGFIIRYHVQALLSPARNRGGAFGGAHWTSWSSMLVAMTVPPAVVTVLWALSRLHSRGGAP
jgi:hypothetical protein